MMKKTTTLFMLSLICVCFTTLANAAPKTLTSPQQMEEVKAIGLEHFQGITAEEFLELTPRKIKETTGQKLSIKQAIALKVAQKKVKKQMKKGAMGGDDQLIALILVLVAGVLGVHRFYLGYTGIGIIQLLTLGLCGIWTLIDMIRIITGDLTPKNGSYTNTL